MMTPPPPEFTVTSLGERPISLQPIINWSRIETVQRRKRPPVCSDGQPAAMTGVVMAGVGFMLVVGGSVSSGWGLTGNPPSWTARARCLGTRQNRHRCVELSQFHTPTAPYTPTGSDARRGTPGWPRPETHDITRDITHDITHLRRTSPITHQKQEAARSLRRSDSIRKRNKSFDDVTVMPHTLNLFRALARASMVSMSRWLVGSSKM